MSIDIQLIGDQAVALKISSMSGKLRQELTTAMNRITAQLVRYVQNNKLSGQVLNVRTGTLRRSIRGNVTSSNTSVTGIVDSRAGGSPVVYAAYHEYGFEGTQSVKEHLRKGAEVRAFTRQVNYKARPFMRPSLAENQEMIIKELETGVKKATT